LPEVDIINFVPVGNFWTRVINTTQSSFGQVLVATKSSTTFTPLRSRILLRILGQGSKYALSIKLKIGVVIEKDVVCFTTNKTSSRSNLVSIVELTTFISDERALRVWQYRSFVNI
jgi:hypothetical protein